MTFKIENRKVGIFNQKLNLLKEKYRLDNGWNIDMKIFKGRYEIKDTDNIIATISQYDKYEEKICFTKNENELLILMVALAISMYNIIDAKYMEKIAKEVSGC